MVLQDSAREWLARYRPDAEFQLYALPSSHPRGGGDMGYDVEGIRTKTPAEHHEKESRSLHFDRAGAKSAPQKGRQAASCIEIAIGRSNRIHLRLDWRPIRVIRR